MATGNIWLMLTTDSRVHGGNDGYDDITASSYTWDDTVPHHAEPRQRDQIVLWDKERLLGFSTISRIKKGSAVKDRHRCPECGATKFKARTTKLPRYRCGDRECKVEFQTPNTESIPVMTYQSDYAACWVDLLDRATGSELRAICASPLSQHSIRQVEPKALDELFKRNVPEADLRMISKVQEVAQGGHKDATVRVRVGQRAFRRQLLGTYGSSCAFTGPAPERAIHACHLYRYAQVGQHRRDGGLMIRADLHTLFDYGLIKVDPGSDRIVIDPSLEQFPNYWRLHGEQMHLRVPLSAGHRRWLKLHWDMHTDG